MEHTLSGNSFTQVTDQWELNQLIQYIKPDNEKYCKEFMY